MSGLKYNKPNISKIKITDPLFHHYTELVAKRVIPYQWDVLNDRADGAKPTYCLENFKVAAGLQPGEHRGVVFRDSDLYKWLEALAFCINAGFCREYEKYADDAIELMAAAQLADGYLNTYYSLGHIDERWTNLIEGHELYCAGHMIEAAVAYYIATGKQTILDIARANADLICSTFGTGEGQLRGYPGHQEIELALVKLYRATKVKRYLDCARYFIDERGKNPNYFEEELKNRKGSAHFAEFDNYDLHYSQSHMPPVEQRNADGHAVRAMYMCSAMADLAADFNDEKLLEASEALWQSTTQRRMYITGGIGSSGFLERFTADYDLPNDSSYCETCASIGLMMFGQRMAALTGKAEYYDSVERALYNTVLAGISVEGDRYFYVNPLELDPRCCLEHTSMQHVNAVRQGWFPVACCPPNIARTLASLGQYTYSENEHCAVVNQYISSTAELCGLTIDMQSSLMSSGSVTFNISSDEAIERALMLRVPYYAGTVKLEIDGAKAEQKLVDGYLVIERLWSGTHTVAVDFDVKPHWVAASLRVREDIGKMALMKGPCVYCLEETDNGGELGRIFAKPNEAFSESPSDAALPGGLPCITYNGVRLTEKDTDSLYHEPATEKQPVVLKAVPYCLWGNREKGEMLVWVHQISDC